ncbi:MAG TPA: HAD family hydrolase, partial [Gaiellaceae bacterium]|nr:HAD family hydrolase [Gaiellaceae bacterium]
ERGVRAFEGSLHYLEIAHDAGVHSAVVSASAHTFMILARAGIADFIDEVVDANTIAAGQLREEPAPDWLLAACRELGVEPQHAAAFETTPAGVAAARAGGFAVVVGVDRAGRPDALRAAGAHVVIAGLADLLDRELAAWL